MRLKRVITYKQKAILLHLHTSKKFLIKMFVVFFDLTEPASKKANPVCITVRERQYYKLIETGTSTMYTNLTTFRTLGKIKDQRSWQGNESLSVITQL